ncbi:MSC_0623 family F1-like ATPase-associated protein [Mycoplasmopsis arginini]|uniref:MSC_0623 family F1-like ATPase-associated protein n=1 Tax=Mycoplasmopsis arginini TaxID=2094 RepID=UPI003D0588E3
MAKKSTFFIERNKDKILFWLEDKNYQNDIEIIDFKKFLSTVLLKNNFKKDDVKVAEFLEKINKSIAEKQLLKFKKFAIDYENNSMFSFEQNIPIILYDQKALSFENNFEAVYNEELEKLINEKYYVEFLPNVILYFSNNTESLKIYIKKDYFLSSQEEKNGK